MKEHYTRSGAARALRVSRQAVSQAVKKNRLSITPEGIPVDDLEQWRIAKVKTAWLELQARQDVPSLLGDARTPSSETWRAAEVESGAKL